MTVTSDAEPPSLATRLRTAWRERLGERAAGITLTILIELLLLAMLLSLGMSSGPAEEPVFSSLTTIDMGSAPEDAAQAEEAAPQDTAEPQPPATVSAAPVQPSQPDTPPMPSALPLPRPSLIPPPAPPIPMPAAPPSAAPQPDRPRAVIRSDRTYGPSGSSSRDGDSPIVGTAPNGEPLYAARWYEEPTEEEMRGYMSVVDAPAYALIACRTAPRWQVTDCIGLENFPPNSRIMDAVLASTWQFQVRPPRRGGQSLVGAWVRIRISYGER